jgi:hypothetical protein
MIHGNHEKLIMPYSTTAAGIIRKAELAFAGGTTHLHECKRIISI